jgi:lysophospholipase L1-like esterase
MPAIDIFKPISGDADVFRGAIASGAAYPAEPKKGHYIVRTDTGIAEWFDGSNWIGNSSLDKKREGEGTLAEMLAADPWINKWIEKVGGIATGAIYDFDGTNWIKRRDGSEAIPQGQVVGLVSKFEYIEGRLTGVGTLAEMMADEDGHDEWKDSATGDLYYFDGTNWIKRRDGSEAIPQGQVVDLVGDLDVLRADVDSVSDRSRVNGCKTIRAVALSVSSSLSADYGVDRLNGPGVMVSAQPSINGAWLSNVSGIQSVTLRKPFGVVIGDSIAEGHPQLHGRLHDGIGLDEPNKPGQLSYELGARTGLYWYNHGIGGQTSTQVRARWDRDVLAQTISSSVPTTLPGLPSYVYINVGVNDIALNVDANTTLDNIEFMLRSARDNNIICIVANIGAWNSPDRGDSITSINSGIAALAVRYGAWLFDSLLWGSVPGDSYLPNGELFADTVHPSTYGYVSMASEIVSTISAPWLFHDIALTTVYDHYTAPSSLALPTSVSVTDGVNVIESPVYGIPVNVISRPVQNDPNEQTLVIDIQENAQFTGSGEYSGFARIDFLLKSACEIGVIDGRISSNTVKLREEIALISTRRSNPFPSPVIQCIATAEASSLGPTYAFDRLNLESAVIASIADLNAAWLSNVSSDQTVTLRKPFGVVIGDSIAEGHPSIHGRLHGGIGLDEPNKPGQISYSLSMLTKTYWYNHGIGSQTTVEMRARWDRDVLGGAYSADGIASVTLPGKSSFVLIIAGVNDISEAIAETTTRENIEWMLKSARDNGLFAIICTVGPWGAATDTQFTQIESLNVFIKAKAEQYGAWCFDMLAWGQSATGVKSVNTLLYQDDVHPTAYGYHILTSDIVSALSVPWHFDKIRLSSVYPINNMQRPSNLARPTGVVIAEGPASATHSLDSNSVHDVAYVVDTDPNAKDFTVTITSSATVVGTGAYSGFGRIDGIFTAK